MRKRDGENRKYKGPVAWLGGRDLLANVKYFALFAAFKGKLDPRDWMLGEVYPPSPTDPNVEPLTIEKVNAFWSVKDGDEFWFDYFADSGDGMTAGYSIAYLCLSDLTISGPAGWTEKSPLEIRAQLEETEILSEIRDCLKGGDSLEEIERFLNKRRQDIDNVLNEASLLSELEALLQRKSSRAEIIAFIETRAAGLITILGLSSSSAHNEGSSSHNEVKRLPRGAFLFVGGDTTYHVADYASLAERFQVPFKWAYEDINNSASAVPREIESANIPESERRPIFGIPGNHDYYDEIDGFNRQFRRPLTPEDGFIDLHGRNLPPLLSIHGFKRCQTASYVAIRLPFDWWFWGVDSELDRLDMRQQEFFKNAYLQSLQKNLRDQYSSQSKNPGAKRPLPQKLIVATSEPTTVYGKRSEADEKTSQAFFDLNLRRPFLSKGRTANTPKEKREIARIEEEDARLQEYSCRLDISGDTHHYTRYWGDSSRGLGDDLSSSNYASVVSGGGGASMSPTQTDFGEIESQAVYPSPDKSRYRVNRQLFNPIRVILGGNVYLAGFIIAFILYFGASLTGTHVDLVNSILNKMPRLFSGDYSDVSLILVLLRHALKLSLFLALSFVALLAVKGYASSLFERHQGTYDFAFNFSTNLSTPEEERPIYKKLLDDIGDENIEEVSWRHRAPFWVLSALGLILTAALVLFEIFFYRPANQPGRGLYNTGIIIYSVLAVVYILGTLMLSRQAHKKLQHVIEKHEELLRQLKDIPPDKALSEIKNMVSQIRQLIVSDKDFLPIWALILLAVGNITIVILESHSPSYGILTPFGSSLCVLLFVAIAVVALIVSIYYSKWLFERSSRLAVDSFSYWPVKILTVLGVGCLAFAVWTFGGVSAYLLVANLAFILTIIAVFLACILLALRVGNDRAKRPLIFSLLGLWHAILQMSVPLLLVWVGNGWSWLLAGATVLIVTLLRNQLAKLTFSSVNKSLSRLLLSLIWLGYGAWMILLPILFPKKPPIQPIVWFLSDSDTHTLGPKLLSLIFVGLWGALMSCVWLGWYFAVSLIFNGHSNEAGSTALVEDYKEFIRFCITKDRLTGYVIGIDKVQQLGTKLRPRIVDIFHLSSLKS